MTRETLYPDADAAYIRIQPGNCHHTNEVDDATFVDLDPDGNPLCIQFLYVSDGVNHQQLPGLTEQGNKVAYSLLQESGIEVIPSAWPPNSRPLIRWTATTSGTAHASANP